MGKPKLPDHCPQCKGELPGALKTHCTQSIRPSGPCGWVVHECGAMIDGYGNWWHENKGK